ncbi:MAG: hypothetical protein QOJ64_1915 [Acidobacteriota bacterium]|jgi:hypothetical protein|nr:hypothetical protein [Acidobacteriota bacterium]
MTSVHVFRYREATKFGAPSLLRTQRVTNPVAVYAFGNQGPLLIPSSQVYWFL